MSKKQASKITEKYRKIYWFLQIIEWVILWLPLIIYFFIALADGGILVTQKVAVVTSFAIALTLTIYNLMTRHNLRSPIWIMLLGLHAAFERILPLVFLLAVVTICDELVIRPALKRVQIKLEASKVIDEHMNA